jgi:hypothetical protein
MGTEGFPVPRITHFVPSDLQFNVGPTAPVTMAWGCPRPGVDRFEVALTPVPPGVTTTFFDGNEAGAGETWGVIQSDRLANGFGSGSPNFAIVDMLQRGVPYRVKVRAVGEGLYDERDTGAWSDEATLTWVYDSVPGGPPPEDCPVPWPARDIAPLITDPARELEARLVDWIDVIPQIGPRPATEICIKVGAFEARQVISVSVPNQTAPAPPRIIGRELTPNLLVPLPFTVYLHQTSSQSRGTMLQVSHYVDEILTTQPQPDRVDIIDRAFAVASLGNEASPPPCLWFRVRHPLMAGRTYRCALVMHGGDREPIETLRTIEISVPALP